MNIDQIITLTNGVEMSLGNAVARLVGALRQDGVEVSWNVIDSPLSDSALRKRAKRLETVAFPYHITKTGYSFDFTADNDNWSIGFTKAGGQLVQDKPQLVTLKSELKVQAKPTAAEDRVSTQYLATPNSIIIVGTDGKPVIVNQDHLNFNKIKAQLEADSTYNPLLLEPVKALTAFEHMGLSYDGKNITFMGRTFQSQMFDRLIDAIRDVTPEDELKRLFAFVRRTLNHPDKVTAERIFDFARCNSIELTDEGNMICYKKVRADYKDVHSGKFDNSPGTVVSMPRQMVEHDHNKTCSPGLHFASIGYMKHFSGARIVSVLVDPADVVGMPYDYNDTKGRACKYIVLEDVTDKLK